VSARKGWQSIVAGSRDLRFRDFVGVVDASGFRRKRTRGSHLVYSHRTFHGRSACNRRGGRAKQYKFAQFLEIVEEFGLRMEARHQAMKDGTLGAGPSRRQPWPDDEALSLARRGWPGLRPALTVFPLSLPGEDPAIHPAGFRRPTCHGFGRLA
jgi:hypothetical protein